MIHFIISFLVIFSSFALEVDSKLTLRIIKVSSSQKTILINRGVEDGLTKNNHAKFFLSSGVVARGVAVKISPTKSVWSLYRIINNSYINPDQVLKLKITEPLKITKDESRSLIKDDQSSVLTTSNPRDLGIPLASGADDLDPKEMANIKASKAELDFFSESKKQTKSSKSFEFFLSGSLESLSSTTKNTNNTYEGSESKYSILIGLEYYFLKASGRLKNLSLKAYLANSSSQTIAFNGSVASETYNEFGGGLSYHITNPSYIDKIIPYLETNIIVGSVSSTFNPGENVIINGSTNEIKVNGSSSSFSIGAGVKYFSNMGLSFRASLDYFSRTVDYEALSSSDNAFDKTQSGPRVFMGIGYKFF